MYCSDPHPTPPSSSVVPKQNEILWNTVACAVFILKQFLDMPIKYCNSWAIQNESCPWVRCVKEHEISRMGAGQDGEHRSIGQTESWKLGSISHTVWELNMCWADVNSVCLLSRLIGPAPTLEIAFKPRMLVQVTRRDTVFGVGSSMNAEERETPRCCYSRKKTCMPWACTVNTPQVCLHLRQVDLGFCIHPSSPVGL